MYERLRGQFSGDGPPYRIRGHHIPHYETYERRGYRPEQAADRIVEASNHPSNTKAYREDMFGKGLKGVDTVRRRFERNFKRFEGLDTDEVVALVEGQPDEHCSAPIVGDHCFLSKSRR